MARYGQGQALSHPVRVAILDLYTEDPKRSLAVDALLNDLRLRTYLAEQNQAVFRTLDAAKVTYHRARLQDVDLLPAKG